MFWKIGFFVELLLLAAMLWMFMKANPMKNEGASSWIDLYSSAPTETIKFLGDTFGITVAEKTIVPGASGDTEYNVIKAKGQMWPFAGVMGLPMPNMQPSSMIYLTVKDYAAAHAKMIANGAVVKVSDQYAGGMRFGVYTIPGDLVIGISEYGNHGKDK